MWWLQIPLKYYARTTYQDIKWPVSEPHALRIPYPHWPRATNTHPTHTQSVKKEWRGSRGRERGEIMGERKGQQGVNKSISSLGKYVWSLSKDDNNHQHYRLQQRCASQTLQNGFGALQYPKVSCHNASQSVKFNPVHTMKLAAL